MKCEICGETVYGSGNLCQDCADLIEEYEGKLFAFEFKWNEKKKASLPKTFSENYQVEAFTTINRRNFNILMKTIV